MKPILNVAAKAVIVNDKGEVLLVCESAKHATNTQAGKFGIPGGRLDPGEAFLDGLNREVLEETGLTIEPLHPLYVGEWRPVIQGVPHQVIAIFMLCKATTHTVRLSEEHDKFAWVSQVAVGDYNVMPPDDLVLKRCWR